MGLQDILSISGKGGLFRLKGSMKNGVIVESLLDGKKSPAHAHNRISALSDISIYGEDGEKPLSEILKAILIKFEGKAIPYKKWSGAELKSEFSEVFPEYDEDRVYSSDLKKIYQWANLLMEKGLIDLEWANSVEEAPEKEEITESED
tara:strand:- start:64177 stop:64620 length:444 start_codon:yes stop_codon:yes gene_type:complete